MDRTIVILVAINAALIGSAFYMGNKYETVCTGESKVVDILELNYRSAKILLANTLVVEVNQATLKPGDMYCYKSESREK